MIRDWGFGIGEAGGNRPVRGTGLAIVPILRGRFAQSIAPDRRRASMPNGRGQARRHG
ncbi:hypothetical protein LC55x_0128 [Lysobacter capsici]|nr:hypothetical protein LC55x_0128 [Lysobacter capsici]